MCARFTRTRGGDACHLDELHGSVARTDPGRVANPAALGDKRECEDVVISLIETDSERKGSICSHLTL